MPSSPDPSIIRDQREMIGADVRHETVADVEAAWEDWAERYGLSYRQRRGDNTRDLRRSPKIVVAYISGGRWIADCPRCNGGIAAWRENPRGACLDCGTIYRVKFPSKAESERAIAVLAERPDPTTRSWHVHERETVDDLVAENERYLVTEEAPTGAVAVDDVLRVLGRRAYEKLQAEGVV
jgi:hypothetical protein